MKIVIATENQNKVRELEEILHAENLTGIEFLTLKDFPGFTLPEETGTTLEENAIIKAVAAAKFTKLPALADDTGLEVDALNGMPGVISARYAGAGKSAEDNNRKLLSDLDGIPLKKRTARFKTVACYAKPDGGISTIEGILEGFIGEKYKGTNGFGYDPLFIVKDAGKTLAEMTAEEKNNISHRKKAFSLMVKSLKA
ncbi:XTP/dITP diphosphohydrolase [Elusimicrobium simillimum]|uniref:XTP/dITP diphosphatase n=1 Tax=Elusimicrobium simillimum TaxID=3143438 RepID=UPI003C7034B5